MRDPKRINTLCQNLAALWSLDPDLRFGQVMARIQAKCAKFAVDSFYMEDDEMLKVIQELIEISAVIPNEEG